MPTKFHLGRFSFFLFCFFPILPSLQAQSALAMLFLLLQILSIFLYPRKSESSNWWFPLFMSLPTLFLVMSLVYSDDLQAGVKYLERSVLLVLMPLVLYFNRALIDRRLQSEVLHFLGLIMAGFACYIIGALLATGKFFEILPLPNSYYYIREFIGNRAHMHPTYFSLLLALPIFAIQKSLGQLPQSTPKFWGYLLVLAVLLLALLLAASKMIMAATLVGSAAMWLQSLGFKKGFIRLAGALALSLVLIFSMGSLRDRASEFVAAFTEEGIDKDNPDSMRKAIYKSTLALIVENPWTGVGIGDAQAALNAKYEEFDYRLAREEGFNTHNNYLHFWLAAGLGPFLFFLLLQLMQLVIAGISKNPVHLAISICFSMSLLSENILARQVGVFVYAFFTAFLVYASWSRSKKLIFINGRFINQGLTGVQRYAREISRQLVQQSDRVRLISPSAVATDLPVKSLAILKGQAWEQITLPIYLTLLGRPPLLNLGNSAPLMYPQNYLTLHDVAFMENSDWFSPKFVRWYRFMVPRILAKAQHVFTVSAFSRQEIIKHFKLSESKISLSYNGCPDFKIEGPSGPPLVEGDYALVVGSITSRKNQQFIIESFLKLEASLSIKLVLAGSLNQQVFGTKEGESSKWQQSDRIIWFESPDDAQLHNLYQHAKFCLYTPIYEGFGLPVLEALVYQRPIIVSDIPVFRELYQDLVIFSPLANQEHLISLITCMAKESGLNPPRELAPAELKQRFSYAKSASLILSHLSA